MTNSPKPLGSPENPVRIGTRASLLATTQTGTVTRFLEEAGLATETIHPIYAVTDEESVYQKLNMLWGIYPILNELPKLKLSAIIEDCNEICQAYKIANKGDVIIITNASRYNEVDTDFIKLHVVK